jgi:5-methylcytosine-specific restriction endonuclease McrA
MRTHDVRRLDDATLLRRLHQLVAGERASTATLLAHLAEVEARRLHVPAGYSSMFDYCLREFRWTEDMAVKRLRAARCARRFPQIFEAIADGRLNVSGVLMLRPHLIPETAGELLAAAFGKTRVELELLLARRFPKDDVPTKIRAVEARPTHASADRLAQPAGARNIDHLVAPGPVTPYISKPARPAAPPAKLEPLTPERFAIQVTVDRETHALLRRAQELLSHQYRSGDVAQVLNRALDQLVRQLEKQKYASVATPRRSRAPKADSRHIPAHVRRAVRERDGERCTFVSASGHRCEARTMLEFDHVVPFARGGTASVAGIRLRCRAHNQYEAERAFGPEFMAVKRARAGALAERRVISGARAPGSRERAGSRAPRASARPTGTGP